ncbi:MAG: hypothetical protein M1337_00930 [Actinobacteria bacterium]|nr:hypothetical protein [Actinomycetota bacterium]
MPAHPHMTPTRSLRMAELSLRMAELSLGAVSLLWAVASAVWIVYAFPRGNQAAFFWAGVIVVLGVITTLSAWMRRPEPAWIAAFALLVLSGGAVWTIGFVVAPVALLVALTAFVVSWDRLLGWWLRLPVE